ncbi:DoxX family protein [Gordonia soli]|uniref:DoxX family protein n=1 Tax=Gordonia soli NBRC 108243 TaxID=1223545 RepID=M0QKW0_9ACTN|nr:DoxX family protein [Gordonia soli]GAC69198.1 hypothetical protein GS4_22_00300 [Gordonia soli NBRC 108243]
MHIAYLTVSAIAVAMNLGIAIADSARAPFVLANSAEVHVPEPWLPWLAACKAAGAVGIAVALVGDVPMLAVAASTGLVLFYLGAVGFHVRAKVFYNIGFPGAFLAVAAAVLVLAAVECPS